MLFRKLEKREEESDTSNLTTPNKWLINLIGGNETYSGESVDTATAMNIVLIVTIMLISVIQITKNTHIAKITNKGLG